ncbi:hypothetical protein NLX86_16700 [Streptomyces sp. A3M-1-3]|uniref:DUF6584 family protein n=1 Tax=Streptomyces sp. A3M-1-3 TaxID=2962044 RepID=UPI0020B6A2C1|nr:DUF6584 family protein [Streptomyces sp. A3M-1-3]MCP3819678.1 hypothetical protein [Streptomyces sp. A3M-1-3]
MPRESTLRTAATEAAAGDLASALRARRRLLGLAGSFPQDLEVRELLAAVYRLLGEADQAGRWNYLCDHREPAETAAFERTFADAEGRMRALRWVGPESDAATPVATGRLRELRKLAERETGRRLAYERPRRRTKEEAESEGSAWVGFLFFSRCALVALLLGVGLVAVVRYVIGLLA